MTQIIVLTSKIQVDDKNKPISVVLILLNHLYSHSKVIISAKISEQIEIRNAERLILLFSREVLLSRIYCHRYDYGIAKIECITRKKRLDFIYSCKTIPNLIIL